MIDFKLFKRSIVSVLNPSATEGSEGYRPTTGPDWCNHPCTVTISQAELSDLPEIIELHLQSFNHQQHLGVMLGRRYIERFWRRAVETPGFVVLIAQQAGRVVGFASASMDGYDPRHGLGLTEMLKAARILARHPQLLHRVFGRWKGATEFKRRRKHPFAQEYVIAAAEEHRRQGIASALRSTLYSSCRDAGARWLYTAVRSDNLPMLRLCARDGFQEMFLQRISGVTYLEKELVAEAATHFASARISSPRGRAMPADFDVCGTSPALCSLSRTSSVNPT